MNQITASQVDEFLESYFQDLASLLPSSSAGLLDSPIGACQVDSGKLIRMVDLSLSKGTYLRHCTAMQVAILALHLCSRVFVPCFERVGMGTIQTDGATRQLTRKEIQSALGLTESQYQRELYLARERVRMAILDTLSSRHDKQAVACGA